MSQLSLCLQTYVRLFLLCYLCSFIKDQLTVHTWGYFWDLQSVTLIYLSILSLNLHCLDYCSFIIRLEVEQCQSLDYVLLQYLALLFFCCCKGFSVVVTNRGCQLVAMASLRGSFSCCGAQALEHSGLSSCSTWAQWLWLMGSGAQVQLSQGLWNHPEPGIDSCFLHWQVDSSPLSDQGSPSV